MKDRIRRKQQDQVRQALAVVGDPASTAQDRWEARLTLCKIGTIKDRELTVLLETADPAAIFRRITGDNGRDESRTYQGDH